MKELEWLTDYESAVDTARKGRKPLLVYIWSPTCVGCYKMKKDTYPDAKVIETLNENFILAKINSKDPPKNFNEIIAPYKYNWSPTIIYKSPFGFELRRQQGFLDPHNFTAELFTALGFNYLYHQRFEEAIYYFNKIINEYNKSALIPEVMYWKGVSVYFKDRKLSSLLPVWSGLREKFPRNIWSIKADLGNEIEDIINDKIIMG